MTAILRPLFGSGRVSLVAPWLRQVAPARVARPASTASSGDAKVEVATPVVLEWEELSSGKDLRDQVRRAFGAGGLGLCAVSGVPGLAEARQALLPLASKLGKLSPEVLATYERADAHYCVGWSCGKEKFKGQPDLSKGSWYSNPLWDDPALGDEKVRVKYPACASKNKWPEAELPELEPAFKAMGKLLYATAQPLVKQCDLVVSSQYPEHGSRLFNMTFRDSRMLAGRLLHYYPGQAESWCGWHNDNSTITGLVPAMWLDDTTGDEIGGVSSDAGLYVQGRSKKLARVAPPPGCLLFQIGEAAQILSGGVLQATPHFVQGHQSKPGEMQVSRETFALFMEPSWDGLLGPPSGATYEDVLRDEESVLIPPLSSRLKPDPDTKVVEFGKLLDDSFQEYYKHNGN